MSSGCGLSVELTDEQRAILNSALRSYLAKCIAVVASAGAVKLRARLHSDSRPSLPAMR